MARIYDETHKNVMMSFLSKDDKDSFYVWIKFYEFNYPHDTFMYAEFHTKDNIKMQLGVTKGAYDERFKSYKRDEKLQQIFKDE